MATVNFTYWLEDVAPSIAGAEVPFILREIRNAAIEFCERSETWRLDALPFDIEAGKGSYILQSPISAAEIVKVLQVVSDNCVLPVTSWAEVIRHSPANVNYQGKVKQYIQEYQDKITLYPTPNYDLVAGVQYKVVLRPSRVSNGMNEAIGKQYFEAIAHGAKARLFEMPGKPWSDGASAVFHKDKMMKIICEARDSVSSGMGRGAKRTVSHF